MQVMAVPSIEQLHASPILLVQAPPDIKHGASDHSAHTVSGNLSENNSKNEAIGI